MAVPIFLEPAAFRKAGDQTLEHRSHRLGHPQRFGRKSTGRSNRGCHLPQTMGELCRSELISGRHGILKLGTASGVDHLFQRILRSVSQPIQSYWLLRRGARPRRCSLPREMVKKITVPSRRTGPAAPGDADGAETIDQQTRFSCAVIHFKPAFDALVVALLHSGMNEARGARRAQEQNFGEAHRES